MKGVTSSGVYITDLMIYFEWEVGVVSFCCYYYHTTKASCESDYWEGERGGALVASITKDPLTLTLHLFLHFSDHFLHTTELRGKK